ncbi:MAG: alginate lyase family protein [Verrucomicrobiales bacterium]
MRLLFTLLLACLNFQPAGAEFAHPGVAHSRESIAFVRSKIDAGAAPWSAAWDRLRESRSASLEWQPDPHAHVERGPSNNPNIGSSDFSRDAMAAYTHALCWALSGEPAHASKAAEIVDAWSGTLESIGNHDARLLVGMSGYHFTIAAELLKHTWDGWGEENQAQFAAMARDIWYPIIADFYPSANGNWDASMLQAMMAMGVFLDDQAMFDRAKEYFLNGKGNGAIGNYFMESGQCQETGRDQGHTQMGLEYLANTCETAWIQGIDLYAALDNRLLKGFEYTAKYNLGQDVPYEPYRSFEGRYHYKTISSKARGRLRPMYERVFNHYHNRKGLAAPYTEEAALKLRSSARRRSSSHLDTLMFSGQPADFGKSADRSGASARTGETLAPLAGGAAPQSFDELWRGFDPRSEPLEVEVLEEWEEDGVVLKVLRYRIGIFKGRKSMMAAIYGYPKGAESLPGLVQIHGGGQYADHKAVLSNARRGYATISLAWAGRISAPGYRLGPAEVKLFWDGAENDPAYKVTTDWGAVEGYHAPSRYPENNFPILPKPAPWTLDAVESPRNNSWFLCTLAARRALTFLEQQPEVDPEKLGVYGHSMGGKLTVLTTGSDDRVKAAAPSCGGISDRTNKNPLYRATIGDDVYLRRISCPIIFLSPANDFHGRIDDLQLAVTGIQSKEWRVTCSPHHNHQDTAEYEVATQLWFDQYLKGDFEFPQTPGLVLDLKGADGVPSVTVKPDGGREVLSVDVFYTQQGQVDGAADSRDNTINRYWRHAPRERVTVTKTPSTWSAKLPLVSTDKPLWVYANITYALQPPVAGAGYYYGSYTADKYVVSSRMLIVSPDELRAAGVRATLEPSLVIEAFGPGWEKQWFTYRPEDWARRTHKIYDERFRAPAGGRLAFEMRSAMPNKVVVGIDAFAVERQVPGGGEWVSIELGCGDFLDAGGKPLEAWAGIKELRLGSKENLRANGRGKGQRRTLGADWNGDRPEFRNLRWIAN